MKVAKSFDELTYEWPENLSQYEAKIFLGLTANEAMATAMAFLLPLGVVRSGWGFLFGAILALLVLASIKKVERFGNQPFLLYFAKRQLERRQSPTLELPLVMGGQSSRVELESWEGETLLTVEALD